MHKFKIMIYLAFMAFIVSCTDQRVRNRFNFDYEVPDEFQVQKNKELEIPKKFDLPPPQNSSREDKLD